MTEFSWPWECTATGDGGPSSLSLDIIEDTNKFLQNLNPGTDGVVYWTQSPNAGLLAPSIPSAGTVRIAAGVGLVEGWLYTNDGNVDFAINGAPGNANATDIIVLQRILASQTVRLARIAGAASSKAVLTQTAATWEIPIVDVLLDGAGNLSSIADARKLALPPGTIVRLSEFDGDDVTTTATLASIPPLFSNIRIVGRARSTNPTATAQASLRFNADAGANYDWIRYRADSTGTLTTDSALADTEINIPIVTAANGTANFFDAFQIEIPAYIETGYKSALAQFCTYGDGTAFEVSRGNGWWQNTAAITQIDLILAGAFVTGSKITFYGEV